MEEEEEEEEGGEGGEGGREEDPEVERRFRKRLRKQQVEHKEEVKALKVREGGREGGRGRSSVVHAFVLREGGREGGRGVVHSHLLIMAYHTHTERTRKGTHKFGTSNLRLIVHVH
jgi:hypothetical protein